MFPECGQDVGPTHPFRFFFKSASESKKSATAKVPQKEIKSKQTPIKPKISTSKGDCNISFSRGCAKSLGSLGPKNPMAQRLVLLLELFLLSSNLHLPLLPNTCKTKHTSKTLLKKKKTYNNMIFSCPYDEPHLFFS